MAETGNSGETGDTGGTGSAGPGEEDRILTLDQITSRLDSLAQKVEHFFTAGGSAAPNNGPSKSGSSAGPPAAPGGGWQSQAATAEQRRAEIRDELGVLKRQEAADAQNAATQERLGALEKAVEKPPRELRKIEQFFGWGDS